MISSPDLSDDCWDDNNNPWKCVNNMNDQVNDNNISRPGSSNGVAKVPSKSEQQRLEKLQLLREKQNTERLRKLEELKEHAAAAAKLREEQDVRRRQHYFELSKKDADRRKAAEERRRFLEEERQTALNAKFESRTMKAMTTSMISNTSRSGSERKYAFGSCTPRLIENYDGMLWKSQYNLNLAPPPGATSSSDNKQHQGRATSAQDLLSGNDDGSQHNRLFFFCGRRKTDLTPTVPIRRDFQSARSTATSGRLSSRSMTRLDKVSKDTGPGRTPSPGSGSLHQRSKSTNQLYKLTRTELLRQEKAKKREGFSSTISTRPPSSLSASPSTAMTSSTHSGVNMRSRPTARKPRPASVHVTGISSSTPPATTPTGADGGLSRKLFEDKSSRRVPDYDRLATPRPRSSSNNPKQAMEDKAAKKDVSSTPTTATTGVARRPSSAKPKKIEERKAAEKAATPSSAAETGGKPIRAKSSPTPPPVGAKKVVKDSASSDTAAKAAVVENQSISSEQGDASSSVSGANADSVISDSVEIQNATPAAIVEKPKENADGSEVSSATTVETEVVKTNGAMLPSADESPSRNDSPTKEETTPRASPTKDLPKAEAKENGVPVTVEKKPEEVQSSASSGDNASADQSQTEETFGVSKVNKILSEEQARAALAEKRRLAREAQERELARQEELRLQEEERQRKEAEEQERLLAEQRRFEDERLQKAIQEQALREAEEQERLKAEEAARIAKELQDKEAAREAERVRVELEAKLEREERERQERKKRVEAIMMRTRDVNKIARNQENQQENFKNIVQQKQEPDDTPSVIPTTMNETFSNLQNNSINNFNNNTTTSTLISFDDNEFNCNTNGVAQQQEQLDGAFLTSAIDTSTGTSGNAAATIQVECNPAGGALTSEKGGGGGGSGGHGSGHRAERDRAIESSLTRITTRLETMLNRVEQLDNRLQRLQSLVSTRLDGLENSLASSKLRIDIINEEVSRVDENLSRRWKAFESKIESNINSLDSKHESKLNLLLREGRRYGDRLHSIFNGIDKRVDTFVGQVNNSVSEITHMCNATLLKVQVILPNSSQNQQPQSTQLSQPTSAPGSHLVSSKVTNMFEVLIESSSKLEGMLRDSVVISNSTRLELQEHFRSLLASLANPSSSFTSSPASSRNQLRQSSSSSSSHYAAPSSEVTTAMAILETLASTESMSNTISRRIADLTRSIDERFEMVSTTLNGFSDNCHRIQLSTPLLEEHIADLLDKMLTAFENRSSSTDIKQIMDKLETMETKCEDMDLVGGETTGTEDLTNQSSLSTSTLTEGESNKAPATGLGEDSNTSGYDEDLLRSTSHLPEEDKKLLFEALFPPRQFNSSLPQVPED